MNQAAHNAEVLCLAFSPVLVPVPPAVTPCSTAPHPSPPAPPPPSTTAATITTIHTSASTGGVADTIKSIDSDAGENKTGLSADVTTSEAAGAAGSSGERQRWVAIDPLDPGSVERLTVARDGVSADVSCSSGGGGGSRKSGGERGTVLVLLASASRDRLVHIFDASANLRPPREWEGSAAAVGGGKDDSLDGRRLGRGQEGEEGVGEERRKMGAAGVASCCYPLLKTLDNHSGPVIAVKFSKDGKRYLCANSILRSVGNVR